MSAKHEWSATGNVVGDVSVEIVCLSVEIVCLQCGKVDHFVRGTEAGTTPDDPRVARDCPRPAPEAPKPIPPGERTRDLPSGAS
jgi:hypothetical protein